MDSEKLLSYAKVAGIISLAGLIFLNSSRKQNTKPEAVTAHPSAQGLLNRNPELSSTRALSTLDPQTKEFMRRAHLTENNYIQLNTLLDLEPNLQPITNPMLGDGRKRVPGGTDGFVPQHVFYTNEDYVLTKSIYRVSEHFDPSKAPKLILGGPRLNLYRDPKKTKAVIVTCGGLCPGLNVIIREVVMSLKFTYGCPNTLMGVIGGYDGFIEREMIELTPEVVMDLHRLGGTHLKSARGELQTEKVCNIIQEKGFNMVFCVGGDGSHRGMMQLVEEFEKRNANITVVGLPKTMDNDIPIIDKSFGFDSAVEEAQRAIDSANVEANSVDMGVGLVKLFGRHSGFIAMAASQASRDVNLCIIPESVYELEGENGYYEYIKKRLVTKRHCVIVVAEGAAIGCLDKKEELQPSGQTDASGNPILVDIGGYLKKNIPIAMKERGVNCTLKYVDPTYMVRTIPANSSDRVLCTTLAQGAVHGAFAGFNNFSVGMVSGRVVYIPIDLLTSFIEGIGAHPGQRRVDTENDIRWWSLMSNTGQPVFSAPKDN